MGVISFLLPLLLLYVIFPSATAESTFSAIGVKTNELVINCGISDLTSTLFLGLPRAFFGGVVVTRLVLSGSYSWVSGVVFRLPFALGFGVPILFFGLSKDFLGLPLPRFATDGGVSSPPLRGTVIVVVRSARRLVGDLFL